MSVGNKAPFVTTSKSNWVVGAQSLQGNRYDGHTLEDAFRQPLIMIKGYRGHGVEGETTVKVVGRRPKRMAHNWIKRRAAIESVIGNWSPWERPSLKSQLP